MIPSAVISWRGKWLSKRASDKEHISNNPPRSEITSKMLSEVNKKFSYADKNEQLKPDLQYEPVKLQLSSAYPLPRRCWRFRVRIRLPQSLPLWGRAPALSVS